jgi:hypothetical protein
VGLREVGRLPMFSAPISLTGVVAGAGMAVTEIAQMHSRVYIRIHPRRQRSALTRSISCDGPTTAGPDWPGAAR